MINIKHRNVRIVGSTYEIMDDLHSLLEVIVLREIDTKYCKQEMNGIIQEDCQKVLSIDTLLKMIYTCCSVNKDTFFNLLEIEQQIMIEVATGKFKLIYKDEEGKNNDSSKN